MRSHYKPILMLLLCTPVLTELLCNNLPPSVFFNPVVFLFLATVGYGFPVLLFREFAIRRQMGLIGTVCLGLAYGIFNEGILAKTFYLATNVPLNTFDNYGRFAGVSVPWAVTISVWHAFHALLYPVLLTYYFFPSHREQPWLTRRSASWIGLFAVLPACLIFFTRSKDREPGQLYHFIIMVLLMGAISWLATRIPAKPGLAGAVSFRSKWILAGTVTFLLLFFVPMIMSQLKVPLPAFYGYYVLVSGVIVYLLLQHQAVSLTACLLFVIGDDILMVLFAMIGAIQKLSLERLATDFVFLFIFAFFILRLKRESRHISETSVTV